MAVVDRGCFVGYAFVAAERLADLQGPQLEKGKNGEINLELRERKN